MRRKITLEEYHESGTPSSTWATDELISLAALKSDLEKIGIPCTTEITVEVDEDVLIRYEYGWVKIIHPLAIYIKWNTQYKKYQVSESFSNEMGNIDSYTVRDVMKVLTEPNQIGVLSKKKVLDWVKYYEDMYNQLKVINDCNALKEKAFRDSLEGLDVKWNTTEKTGVLLKNGIEFSFEIGKTSISKAITLHYSVPNSLQGFIDLSDNNYKNKNK